MYFVRTASEQDLPAVGKLLSTTWHATYDAAYGVERVNEIVAACHSAGALKKWLATPASEFLVADSGRDIAGMAFASMTGKNIVTLQQLCVLPERQRQGIGSDLFAEMETCFDTASAMRVKVDEASATAMAFCRRLGFEQTGETVSSPFTGASAAVLEKSLI